MRDPANAAKVEPLTKLADKHNAKDRLKLFKADLMDEGSFDEAVQGADYVLHTASPFVINGVSLESGLANAKICFAFKMTPAPSSLRHSIDPGPAAAAD